MTTVIPFAGRKVAPASPAQGIHDPIQLYAEAHNALSMALFHLRQPDSNVPGALRKAVQALAALNQMQRAGEA